MTTYGGYMVVLHTVSIFLLTAAKSRNEMLVVYLLENCGLYKTLKHIDFWYIPNSMCQFLNNYIKQTEEKELEQVCRQNGVPKELNLMMNTYL